MHPEDGTGLSAAIPLRIKPRQRGVILSMDSSKELTPNQNAEVEYKTFIAEYSGFVETYRTL